MLSKLEVRMMQYFILILLAATMIGIEFYVEIGQDLKISVAHNDAQLTAALEQLRNKIVVMFGVLTLVVAIVMIMFIKNITAPLSDMIEVARQINEGDLSQVVVTETRDEIGQLGETMNALTSNLQEIASLTHATSRQALLTLDRIRQQADSQKPVAADDVESLEQSLNMLNDFVDSFTLLHT